MPKRMGVHVHRLQEGIRRIRVHESQLVRHRGGQVPWPVCQEQEATWQATDSDHYSRTDAKQASAITAERRGEAALAERGPSSGQRWFACEEGRKDRGCWWVEGLEGDHPERAQEGAKSFPAMEGSVRAGHPHLPADPPHVIPLPSTAAGHMPCQYPKRLPLAPQCHGHHKMNAVCLSVCLSIEGWRRDNCASSWRELGGGLT
mmetsp:Transcript_20605/g.50201  ORF Transcript_20605/g.50201 Transcript_20605/m.50201 type:complete len:203 (+) Transcript_20605:104-712(+)